MREEFVDPLPDFKTDATLIVEKTRVKCFVVDVNVDEFCVAVPGAEQYEGDPKMMLVTGNEIHPVRLTLQEAHAGGYSYRLKRLTTDVATKNTGFLKNFHIHHAGIKCIAAGLAFSAIASFWFISSDTERYQLLCLRSIRRDLSGWWPPAINDNDKVPPGISIDDSLVVKKESKFKPRKLQRGEPVEAPASELRTVSISMISPASMSAPSLLPEEETRVGKLNSTQETDSNSSSRPLKRKVITLASLLEDGQVGRLRTLTPELIPWLFGSATANQLGYLRISDAAFSDLQQFELGLHGLPTETCMDAIESLRRSLSRSSNANKARTVYGFTDLFVIRSDDADIFFRTRRGTVEIVRVLPIDFNKAE